MCLDRIIGHYLSVVVKVHNEQHLFGAGDFSNHFAVSPLLAGFVGVLEQRGSQQVPDLGLGHSYLYLIDLPGGAGRNATAACGGPYQEHNQQNHHLFHLSTFFGQLSCPHYFKCKVSGYLVPK